LDKNLQKNCNRDSEVKLLSSTGMGLDPQKVGKHWARVLHVLKYFSCFATPSFNGLF